MAWPAPATGRAQVVGAAQRLGRAPRESAAAALPSWNVLMLRRQFEGSLTCLGPRPAMSAIVSAPSSRRGSPTCGDPSTTTPKGLPLSEPAILGGPLELVPPTGWLLCGGALLASARGAPARSAPPPTMMLLHTPLRGRPSMLSRTHPTPLENG